ncbi:MAG: hypothetical protein ACK5XV_06040 [Flavobacteriales bacterium]|jgi:hypothetical protein
MISLTQPTPAPADVMLEAPSDKQERALQIELKALEVQEKRYQLHEGLEHKAREERERLTLDKIKCLESLMTAYVVDENKSIIGSDTIYKSAFTEEETWVIRGKILELVRQL